MGNRRASQALFRSLGRDGADWLFVVRSDDGWGISRNGIEIDTGERTSVIRGVDEFLSLTRVIAGAKCSAAVDTLLDRIKRGGSTTVKVAKYQGRIRPHASKEPSAYLTKCGTA